MSIDVTLLEDGPDAWNRFVDQSPEATPFHRYEALSVLADRTGWTLHPLVGRKGQEPVGILPLFEGRHGPLRELRSPPPGVEVFYLGPARLNFAKLGQRKAERRNRAFVEGCAEWIDDRDPDYVDVRTVDRYTDTRPFQWRGFEVAPSYTYVLDLSPEESELLDRLSREARRNVTDVETDYAIEVGDVADARAIVADVRARHEAQGEPYPLDPQFVADLHEALSAEHVRPYVCRADGRRVGGLVALEYGDTIYRWQGGVRPDGDVDIPVNDLLDWHVIRDARERGLARYDFVGANVPRLCAYKAKWAPDPVPYYVVTRSTLRMQVASAALARARGGLSALRAVV